MNPLEQLKRDIQMLSEGGVTALANLKMDLLRIDAQAMWSLSITKQSKYSVIVQWRDDAFELIGGRFPIVVPKMHERETDYGTMRDHVVHLLVTEQETVLEPAATAGTFPVITMSAENPAKVTVAPGPDPVKPSFDETPDKPLRFEFAIHSFRPNAVGTIVLSETGSLVHYSMLEQAMQELNRLTRWLHSTESHPGYFYETTYHSGSAIPIDWRPHGWEINTNCSVTDTNVVRFLNPTSEYSGVVVQHWRKKNDIPDLSAD